MENGKKKGKKKGLAELLRNQRKEVAHMGEGR